MKRDTAYILLRRIVLGPVAVCALAFAVACNNTGIADKMPIGDSSGGPVAAPKSRSKTLYSIRDIVHTDKGKGVSTKFPVVTYMSDVVSARINDALKAIATEAAEDGITSLDYNVSFCNERVLSIQFDFEGMGAYPSHWREYYNFSSTGSRLTLDSLIVKGQMNNFAELVKKQQAVNIDSAVVDFKRRLATSDIDSDTYKWAMDGIVGNCMDKFDHAKFMFSDSTLVVIIDCEFPHAIQCMNPLSDVAFSFAALKSLLLPEYLIQR